MLAYAYVFVVCIFGSLAQPQPAGAGQCDM